MAEFNTQFKERLKVLGIESRCQWDVLVFLDRHPTSLVGADQIGRLLGYADDPVVSALDVLESLGFVERSRATRGARLYQFTAPASPPRKEAFEGLMDLAGRRVGRLLVYKHLSEGGGSPPQGPEASRRLSKEAQQVIRVA